ncbi:MAG: tetratricopeptide repeat protein [Thermoplasmata archaeon]
MSTLYKMIELLRKRNVILTPELEGAFYRVDLRSFVEEEYAFLACEDVPLPCYHSGDQVELLPSPRMAAIALQLLDVEKGSDILIFGANGGYLAALAFELSRGGRVQVVEENTQFAKTTRRNLSRSGYDSSIQVSSSMPQDEWSRVLFLRLTKTVPEGLRGALDDMGVLVYPRRTADRYEFVKFVRNGEEFLELAIREAPTAEVVGPSSSSLDVSAALALEELLRNVWRDRPLSSQHRYFEELTESTFLGGPWDEGSLGREEMREFRLAKKVFQLAYIYQMLGELENAEGLYRKSIDVYATAEAHTFLGWTYSFADRLDDAIEECKRAIKVDPTFGNPYNDIGAYLIQLGRLDEAISWLRRATKAERYCCYFYAHCNLGRVYMMKGDLAAAKQELERALEINPAYELARRLLQEADRLLKFSGSSP